MGDKGVFVPTHMVDAAQGVPCEVFHRYVALADAVTRLHEAHDLLTGLRLSRYSTLTEEWDAQAWGAECLRAVLAARAAVDGGRDG